MNRRVSRPAAFLLALVMALSTPSAFAATYGRDLNPSFGSRIVKILKQLGRKFGVVSNDDVVYGPPIP